jgi:23S rRNA U2552 (ribose-2'-O)-methylase RlmE/FtsJ
MTVAGFVGTGSFLIRYSNGDEKETYLQLKKFRDYFEQHHSFNLKISKLRSSFYVFWTVHCDKIM